jgi:23S rRNA pseudouridine1911/1915/1917 synthase
MDGKVVLDDNKSGLRKVRNLEKNYSIAADEQECGRKEQFTVDEAQAGVRLDKLLAGQFDGMTRSYLQKLVQDGAVTVNGRPSRVSAKPSRGDVIEICIPQAEELQVEAEDIPLDILYEDQDLLIVNKPKGMVVHPAAGHYSGTLVNAVMFHCKDSLSGINGVLRPGIVHRIDQNTTGSLIICKNDRTHQAIAEQLQVHSITRKYRAIVHGRLTEDGTIHTTIGRHPQRRKEMAINVPGGKDAVTHYHVLETFDKFTYVECRLETGRTHQIRVHMKSIGHPILGDDVYGPAKCPFPKLQGQTLHAMTIGFIHPSTGAYMEFEAPLPEYFTELLRKLR